MMITTLLSTSLLSFAATTAPIPAAKDSTLSLGAVALPSLQDFRRDGVATHSDWYIQVGFQAVTTSSSDGPGEEIDFDEGFAIPVLIGRRFSPEDRRNLGFAVEFEVIYTQQDAEDGDVFSAVRDVNGLSALFNGILDYSLTERFGLYGGVGLGVSYLDVGTESNSLSNFEDDDGPFLAWQAKAGVLYQATDTIGIDLGYRFLNIDDAKLDDTNGNASFELQTEQHMLGLGVRFDF